MDPTERKVITCKACRRWKLFEKPTVVEQKVLQVKRCDCGQPLTMIWLPPSRFSLLEVD